MERRELGTSDDLDEVHEPKETGLGRLDVSLSESSRHCQRASVHRDVRKHQHLPFAFATAPPAGVD
jgi:hypothetical protein